MTALVYAVVCGEGRERDAARALLALALRRELGIAPLPRMERAPGGKPFFPALPQVRFSLSHSHGAAVCAVHDREIGVDVERLRPAPRRLGAGMDDEGFFRLWTAREATAKRRGQGLGFLLGPEGPDDACRHLEGLLPGYLVAVCPEEEGTAVRSVRVTPEALAERNTQERIQTGGTDMTRDETFTRRAIELSALAVEHGNEPFGAVLVKDGEIVCTNENQIYSATDPTFHAEAGLLRRFCAETHVTDLSEYTLYSSCEPCFMCSGALVWTKLGRLVYAASNEDLSQILGEAGCACSEMVFAHSHHRPQVTAGVLREESLEILRAYFAGHAKG